MHTPQGRGGFERVDGTKESSGGGGWLRQCGARGTTSATFERDRGMRVLLLFACAGVLRAGVAGRGASLESEWFQAA
eukprot:635703-Pleurochrysis_carterae.AAC.1